MQNKIVINKPNVLADQFKKSMFKAKILTISKFIYGNDNITSLFVARACFRNDIKIITNRINNWSRIVRKPDFCLGENKGADQLRGNREADQRLCFRYSDSTIPLLLKSEISSF